MERLPIWSIYRRTHEGFEPVGFVAALTERHAIELGCRLPGAPRYPVACLKHKSIKPDFVLMDEPAAGERRTRRWAA